MKQHNPSTKFLVVSNKIAGSTKVLASFNADDIRKAIMKWPSRYETKEGRTVKGEVVSRIPGALRDAGWSKVRRLDEDDLKEMGLEIISAQYAQGAHPTGKYVRVVVAEDVPAKKSGPTKRPVKSSVESEFDALMKKLVPRSGKAATQEGELVRAAAKVTYRWYNDGDKFFEGYGCETAGPSASFLWASKIPGMRALIDSIPNSASRDAAYEKAIEKMLKLVISYVASKEGKFTKNTVDNLDTKSRWVETEETEDDYDPDED